MTSGRLDLTDNTTCYLTNSGLDIQFYSVNLTNLGRNTSLGQHQSEIIKAWLCNRSFFCMEATYPYAIESQRKTRNTPSRGL